MSAHTSNEEVESYDEGESEEKEREEGKDKGEVDRRASEERSSRSPEDGYTRPFILPKIWTVNHFKPTMMANIFKNLRDRYQIPDHIPIRFPGKFKKCYSWKTANVNMYDAMFKAGLRLSLTALHY